MALIKIDKILLAAPAGKYKTRTALAYTEHLAYPRVAVLFDSEHGADNYIVEAPAEARPGGPWYVERIVAGRLAEIQYILAVIETPKIKNADLRINRKEIDWEEISEQTLTLAKKIKAREVVVDTIVFDTVTRLCEMTMAKRFGDLADRGGDELVEKLSTVTWGKIKDDISEVLFKCLQLHLNLIMTGWAKNDYDKKARRPIDKLVADVYQNVRYFPDLEVLLESNPKQTVHERFPPMATVVKSRLGKFPEGAHIPAFTWANVLVDNPHVEERPADLPTPELPAGEMP